MIGKRLKSLLSMHNMTQAELCRKLHMSPGNMSNYINDQRSPGIDALGKIANFFSVSVESFVSMTEYKQPLPIPLSSLTECCFSSAQKFWAKIDCSSFSPVFKKDSIIFLDKTAEIEDRDCLLLFRKNTPGIYRFLQNNGNGLLIPFRNTEMPFKANLQNMKDYCKITYSAHSL